MRLRLSSYLIMCFFSKLPILRLTDDRHFGKIKREGERTLRLSLFSINWGTKIYCAVSWALGGNKQFKWLHQITFDSIPDEATVNRKVEAFRSSLIGKAQELRQGYQNMISFRLNQEDIIKTKSFNKLLAYLAVVAFLVPLYVPYALKVYTLFAIDGIEKWIYLALLIVLIHSLINIYLLIAEMINIKEYVRYTVGAIRQAEDPVEEFLVGQYHDWFWSKEERRVEVSVMKNIEKYMANILGASILFIVTYNIVLDTSHSSAETTVLINSSQVEHIDLSLKPDIFFDQYQKLFVELQNEFLNDKIESIVLLKNDEKTSSDPNYKRVLSLISTYNINNIKVIEILDEKAKEATKDDLQLLILRREL
ncbi:hypothetical protein ACFVS2_07990 [Brevibacillus sp. NPDC058079]|uniref:hypothetical protein n=1 Tax=Brevibacillus sp. NPDC058079 TaxID=3346330 RepID=UPI0036F059D5